MSTDPTERRAEGRSVRKPRRPGPLARWIWNPRWIPGFVLAQVAVLLLFAEKSAGSFEGVPGGFGALLSVAAAIVCGPIAGALVSLVGGLVFVPLVTDFQRGSQFSVFLWLIASVGSGVIAGRLRQANDDRTSATARERLAGNRLHRLQAVTEVLARATNPEDVANATVSAAIDALGADVGGLTIRAGDDPGVLRVLVGSALDEPDTGWKPHGTDRPAPGPEIVRTGRPIFIETRDELLARFPIVRRIERGAARFGGFAGVPVALGTEVLGALSLGFHRDHMVPPEERGLLLSIAHQAAIALDRIRSTDDERRARATAEHAEDRLRKLQAVSDAANAASGLDELVERVLPVVRDAVRRRRHVLPLVVGRRPRPPAQGAGRGCRGSDRGRRDPAGCRGVRSRRRDRQATRHRRDDARRRDQSARCAGDAPTSGSPCGWAAAWSESCTPRLPRRARSTTTTPTSSRASRIRSRPRSTEPGCSTSETGWRRPSSERSSRCRCRTCRASRSQRCTGRPDSVTRWAATSTTCSGTARSGTSRSATCAAKARRPPPSWA